MQLSCLIAFEAARDGLPAVIEKQAQGDWNVKVDSQHIGFDGSAKANSRFKIDQPLDEGATRGRGWGPDNKVNQVVQQVGTDAQFQGVFRASGLGRRGWGDRGRRGWGDLRWRGWGDLGRGGLVVVLGG